MKKRRLNLLVALFLFLISLLSLFAKLLKIEFVFSTWALNLFILIAAIFIIHISFSLENKMLKAYSTVSAVLLMLLALIPLLSTLFPYSYTLNVNPLIYKIVLLVSSIFAALSAMK